MRTISLAPPPAGARLHMVRAAGFLAPAPDVRNAHLIPPAEHAAMQGAWTWGEYGPIDVGVYALENVTLAEEGLVFLPGLSLVPASVTQHIQADIDAARTAVASMADAAALEGPHVLCVKRGATNYGHWLAEMLPMALLANRLLGDGLRFLVPPHGGALGETIRASLLLAGIGPERIVPLGPAPRRVRDLIMVHGLSLHGLYLSPLVADLLQELTAAIPAAHPGCSLWVSRAGQPRCFWRERDIGTVLHGMGWQVVNPGSLPFPEQVALFKGATRIAGVMGAGLANLLFAPPGARVELFAPAGMPDTFFYLISCLRGLRYRETRCFQTSEAFGSTPWDAGLVQTLPELMEALANRARARAAF